MKSLHLATPDDLPKLAPMIAGFHGEQGLDTTPEDRETALRPLLEGSPYGAVWLIGPRRAPVGYIAITFGWSLEYGGLDAIVDEFYVRPAVRGRGMGLDALDDIAKALKEAGVHALHLEVDREDIRTHGLYTRAKFKMRDRYVFMSRAL